MSGPETTETPSISTCVTDRELVAAIRELALQRLPAFDRRRAIADILLQSLLALGSFRRTSDSRAFFFHKTERRLYDVEQTPFRHLLTEISGLSVTENLFRFALDRLQASAHREARLVEVHTFSYFNQERGFLAISDGTGGVWSRELGGDWKLLNNGDNDLLFFTEPEAAAWSPDFSGTRLDLQWFLNLFMFSNSPLTADESRTLLLIWLVQQFFPALRRTRMTPAFLGPQGSGKSTATRIVGRLLVGPTFEVTGLQRNREDAFTATITNRIVVGLDNADSSIPFLPDALARYATGQRHQLRKLYTTNEEASFSQRAILMISSRDPKFNRPDVAERLLPLNFDRPKEYRPEFEIFDELEKRRSAILGSLLLRAGEIADALPAHPAKSLRFRMADFASFGERVSASLGKSPDWIKLLDRVEKAQAEFASDGDGVVDALRVLLTQESIKGMPVGDLYQKCEQIANSRGYIFPKSKQSFGRRLSSMRRVIEIELGVRFLDSRKHADQRVISLLPPVEALEVLEADSGKDHTEEAT